MPPILPSPVERSRRERLLRAAYWFAVAAFALLMLWKPRLGPLDDHGFLATIQRGGVFPLYVIPSAGRFFPLCGQEYTLLSRLSASPLFYYAFNALEFLAFSALFQGLMRKVGVPGPWRYAGGLFLFFVPGFPVAWFRLLVAERSVVVFLAAFLWCYWDHLSSRRPLSLALGVAAANVAFYYKEPCSLVVAGFVLTRFFLRWRRGEKGLPLFDGLLLASAAVHLGLYEAMVRSHIDVRYGEARPGLTPVLKVAVNVLLQEPALFFLLAPAAAARVLPALRGRSADPNGDSLLAAACAYAAAFFALKMYLPYYLLPAYVFALPPLLKLFSGPERPRGFLWKGLWAGFWVFFLAQSVPLSLYQASYWKLAPVRHDRMLDFLEEELRREGPRRRLFLDGVNRVEGVELYISLARFLESRGLGPDSYDLLSDEPPRGHTPLLAEGDPRFSVFGSSAAARPGPGDLLLLTPYATKNPTEEYRAGLEAEGYDLVFSAAGPSFPYWSAKSLVKRLSGRNEALWANNNLLQTPDYRVYQKR